MSPDECIAALDEALAVHGEDVILRRIVGQAPNTINIDVVVRAKVEFMLRGHSDLGGEHRSGPTVGSLRQLAVRVVISPTQINAAQWSGGQVAVAGVNPRVPMVGDRLLIDGRWFDVEIPDLKKVGGVVVRLELMARGMAG